MNSNLRRVKALSKAAYNNTYFIGDAALYAEEIIKTLADENQLFIARVPQKRKEARALINKAQTVDWKELQDGYYGYLLKAHRQRLEKNTFSIFI